MSAKASFASVLLSAVLASGSSFASDRCATHEEFATLKVAAIQQQLMVAALTCHQASAYNRFVTSFRPELQRSDHAMLSLFLRKDGASGDAEYNAYKTKLANLSMLRKNSEGRAFCRDARSEFAALKRQRSFSDFAAARSVYLRLPFEDCGGQAAPAMPVFANKSSAMQDQAHAPARHKHRAHNGGAKV